MLRVDARLTGDFNAALKRFGDDVQGKVCLSGAAAMARVLQDHVTANAAQHVKTGKLVESTYRRYVDNERNPNRKTYRVTWAKRKAPHGHFLEYGTSRAPAYPFVAPAFDHMPEAIEAGKKRMAERLQELNSGQPGGSE